MTKLYQNESSSCQSVDVEAYEEAHQMSVDPALMSTFGCDGRYGNGELNKAVTSQANGLPAVGLAFLEEFEVVSELAAKVRLDYLAELARIDALRDAHVAAGTLTEEVGASLSSMRTAAKTTMRNASGKLLGNLAKLWNKVRGLPELSVPFEEMLASAGGDVAAATRSVGKSNAIVNALAKYAPAVSKVASFFGYVAMAMEDTPMQGLNQPPSLLELLETADVRARLGIPMDVRVDAYGRPLRPQTANPFDPHFGDGFSEDLMCTVGIDLSYRTEDGESWTVPCEFGQGAVAPDQGGSTDQDTPAAQ